MTTTTTVSGMQELLETPGSNPTGESGKGRPQLPSYATALDGKRALGWDPHEVWLDRIKRPRDDRRFAR